MLCLLVIKKEFCHLGRLHHLFIGC